MKVYIRASSNMYLVCNKTVSDYQMCQVVKRRTVEIFEKHPPSTTSGNRCRCFSKCWVYAV